MSYLDHILTLEFSPLSYTATANHSNLNACHQNCENYCAANGGEHILGWLKVPWKGGHRYLCHSCVSAGGILMDITPRWLVTNAEFAMDTRLKINPEVSTKFQILDSLDVETIASHYDVSPA